MSTAASTQSQTRIVNGRVFHVTRIATAAPATKEVRPFDRDARRHYHAVPLYIEADDDAGFPVPR